MVSIVVIRIKMLFDQLAEFTLVCLNESLFIQEENFRNILRTDCYILNPYFSSEFNINLMRIFLRNQTF